MSDFIQKRDFWAIVLFAMVFIGFYVFSKELSSNNLLIVLSVSGFGAFAGYKLASLVANKTTNLKLLSVLFCGIIFTCGLLIVGGNQNNKLGKFSTYEGAILEGIWETDNSEGYKIRLEISGEKAVMSMSPDFQKFEYELIVSDNRMLLEKEGEIRFDFGIEKLGDESFTIIQSGESLVFNRLF